MQVALAWLLQRSPNILVIPGTSSLKHLRENLKAATLKFPLRCLPISTQYPNKLPRFQSRGMSSNRICELPKIQE
jgi:hypothetical protein